MLARRRPEDEEPWLPVGLESDALGGAPVGWLGRCCCCCVRPADRWPLLAVLPEREPLEVLPEPELLLVAPERLLLELVEALRREALVAK